MLQVLRRCRHGRFSRLAAAAAVAAGLVLGAPLSVAHADGDPASDVLVADPPLFLPPDSGATLAQEVALVRELRNAAAHGHPLRVAIIVTRSDLGSLGTLWGHPEGYASVLGIELSLQFRGELLVVMPNGFGVSRGGAPITNRLSDLVPRRGELVVATEQAIHALTGAVAPRTSGVVSVGPSRTSGIGWWTATVLALGALGLAWTMSLRRRPVGALRRASHPG